MGNRKHKRLHQIPLPVFCLFLSGLWLILGPIGFSSAQAQSSSELLKTYLPLVFYGSNRTTYSLDSNASGVMETLNNIANLIVVSRDANDLKAEYRAGFVQGKLQGKTILSARDNAWDLAYLLDPQHTFPKQLGPTPVVLQKAAQNLNSNYLSFIG